MEKVHSLISLLIRAVNFTSIFYKHCILLPQNSHTWYFVDCSNACMHTVIFAGRSRTATDCSLPDSTCWGIPGHSRMPQLCSSVRSLSPRSWIYCNCLIRCHSRLVAAPPDVLDEIVAALKY